MRAVYLDHNATTPVRPEVARRITECLEGPAGNPSSRHSFGQEAARLLDEARDSVAESAGCPRSGVVFTSGGTEADNLALRGVLAAGRGRHLVTAGTEHEAVLQTAEALEAAGLAEVTVLAVDAEGRVDPGDVARSLRPDTALVSLMAANNETGALAPFEEIGEVCRRHGVPFHTDAVQLFGKLPFSLSELPVDLASISSHKIGGPKGVGALLVRPGVELQAQVTGGSQERRLRPGTENLPGIVGFGLASRLAARELTGTAERLGELRDRLEAGIRSAWSDARVNAERGPRLPNTSNITFAGLDGESLMIALDLEGIAVSTGAACNAGASAPSHVLLAMGRTPAEAGGSIRFSLGSGSTESDVEQVLSVLPGIARRLAGSGAPS